MVDQRARDLKITEVYQGALNKAEVFEKILKNSNVSPIEVAFVGDDIVDIPVLKRVGFSAAVADALEIVKRSVDYVTTNPGGHGAVREICEMILQAQKRWSDVAKRYDFVI